MFVILTVCNLHNDIIDLRHIKGNKNNYSQEYKVIIFLTFRKVVKNPILTFVHFSASTFLTLF